MHKFKIGDKVKVIETLKDYLGKSGYITEISSLFNTKAYKVRFEESLSRYFWEQQLIFAEPAKENIDLIDKLEQQHIKIVKLYVKISDLELELAKYKPKPITKTVYFYRDDSGNIFSLGHRTTLYTLIAIKEITFTEGEGLNVKYDKE